METVEAKPKKRDANQLRIVLKKETIARVNRWANQIGQQKKGIKIRVNDLVEYVLMSHPEELTETEMKEYQDRYTSDVDFAKWLVKELTAAEGRGEKLKLSDLIATTTSAPPAKKKGRKKRNAPSQEAPISDENQTPIIN